MYVYMISPIDFGWDALPTLKSFLNDQFDEDLSGERKCGKRFIDYPPHKLLSSFEAAKEGALKIGWEGDFRKTEGEPHVFFIPIGYGTGQSGWFDVGFVWKQEHNGTTFVASPVELPHLDLFED